MTPMGKKREQYRKLPPRAKRACLNAFSFEPTAYSLSWCLGDKYISRCREIASAKIASQRPLHASLIVAVQRGLLKATQRAVPGNFPIQLRV